MFQNTCTVHYVDDTFWVYVNKGHGTVNVEAFLVVKRKS
jgi:hypothetical protein